jgi:hypothetical protein
MKTRSPLAALCRAIIPILLLLALTAARAQAQSTPNPPGQISYQGFLVDANGIPLATNAPANYGVEFRIYNGPAAGATLIWGELQTVTVDRGYFSVLLGQGSALNGAPSTNDLTGVFLGSDASDRYIGITVEGLAGGNVEIQPRMRLLASPYALLAHNANNALTLNGYDWSDLFPDTGNPLTGTFPGGKIAADSIGQEQIQAGAVGSAQIATNSVGSAQIANGAVGTAEIAAGAVTASQIGLPLTLSAGVGSEFIRSGSTPPAVLEITNTAVSSISLPFRFFAGYGLKAGGATAIAAYSQAGASAFLADGSDAGDFYGPVNVNGTLTKSGGSFKIDDPLDPANKYLSHSFVESPDMKNIYDGVVTLDASGQAEVALPDWFGALNKDFRYQLTAMGAPGPNLYIAAEISENRFKIAGGAAGAKVSWQVTGTRQDAWANAHRIPVEELKPAQERGSYLAPELFGQPQEKSVRLARRPAAAPAQQ